MLSRSSWRAARVLKAARGFGSGEPPPAPSAAAAWSNTKTESKLVVAKCTCSARHFSQSSRLAARQDEEPHIPISSSQKVDVKGKGRQEEQPMTFQFSSSADDQPLATEQDEGTSYHSGVSAKNGRSIQSARGEGASSISEGQAEAGLLSSIQDQSEQAIGDSWARFRALSLERRQNLSHSTLAKLTELQKSAPMHRRGPLWNKLHWIYQAWKEAGSEYKKKNMPREELDNTLAMLREWFEQKEVEHNIRHFAQARSLCVTIGEMLDPQEDVELVGTLAELLYDYGSTQNLTAFAESLVQKLETSHSASTPESPALLELMTDIYSKMVSCLAQRRHEVLALQLAVQLELCKIPLHVEDCRRDILVAMLARQLEAPTLPEEEAEITTALQQAATRFGEDSHFADWWLQYNEQHAQVEQALAEGEDVQEIDLIAIMGGDNAKTALSLLKNRMRYLLTSRPTVRCSPDKLAQEELRIEGLMVVRAVEALRMYEGYLADGYEADREAYRLAKMARTRSSTFSNFSRNLREAAHMRAVEHRKREAMNFKKKWFPPAAITGRWEEEEHVSSEERQSMPNLDAEHSKSGSIEKWQLEEEPINEERFNRRQRENPYRNASLGQILHLAIETGDTDLARATFQAVREDPSFCWTLNDTPRVLSLLRILIADAKRRDLSKVAKQDAVQIACAFYVRWQEDLNRNEEAHQRNRRTVPALLRSPAFDLILLAAQHQQAYSYAVTLRALVHDPSITLTSVHMKRFATETLRPGARHWIALKLYLAQNILHSSDQGSYLCTELDRAVTAARVGTIVFSDRAKIRWYNTVLQFMDHLDVPLSPETFKRVLKLYHGKAEAIEGSPESITVKEMHKIGLKPLSLKDSLLVDLRLAVSDSSALGFLNLLEENNLLEAARMMRTLPKALLKRGQGELPRLVARLFLTVAEGHADSQHVDVLQAVEIVKGILSPVEIPRGGRFRSREVERIQAILSEPLIDLASQTPLEEAPAATIQQDKLDDSSPGFLSEFFADQTATKIEEAAQHDWKPAEYKAPSSAWQPSQQPTSNWQEATLGFQNAVGPENVQAAAATATHTEDVFKPDPQARSYVPTNGSKVSLQQQPTPASFPVASPSQAYSTLASQPDFFVSHSPTTAPPSILHELSQLPQQFADLTMDQILALKRRYEIEMRAIRRKDEELLAARRLALSRADASRWHGWQEFQATPWY